MCRGCAVWIPNGLPVESRPPILHGKGIEADYIFLPGWSISSLVTFSLLLFSIISCSCNAVVHPIRPRQRLSRSVSDLCFTAAFNDDVITASIHVRFMNGFVRFSRIWSSMLCVLHFCPCESFAFHHYFDLLKWKFKAWSFTWAVS